MIRRKYETLMQQHERQGAGVFSISIADQAWKKEGICAQSDPDSFFPSVGEPSAQQKKICFSCPVQSQCLEEALEGNEQWGIWGGYSPRERREIKSKRRSVA